MDQWKNTLRRMIERRHNGAKCVIETLNYHTSSDEFGFTVLHYSAEYGNEDIMQYLLEKGCNANAQDKSGKTPLMMAVKGNHEAVTKMLLTAGADINIRNNENKSALHMVFSQRHVSDRSLTLFLTAVKQQLLTSEDTAKYLIDAGCQLYHAVFLKDTAIIEYMLLHGLQINSRRPIDGKTALHLAVELGELKIVRLLLERGADVKIFDDKGATPLRYLYLNDSENTREKLDVLQIFFNLGGFLTERTFDTFFQISPILVKGNREAIRIILQSNFDLTSKDNDDKTVLHYLAQNTNPGVVEELKCHVNDFDVNAIEETDGMSPLFAAAKEANIQMVKFLLEAGADVNFVHRRGFLTPFVLACEDLKPGFENQHDQCFELLLQHKATVQSDSGSNKKPIALFDFALESSNNINKMKAAVAHVAMLEGLGIPITQITLSKINSRRPLKRYFKRCQLVLKREIVHLVTVLELLTDPKQKMARYIGSELVQKLARLHIKNKVKLIYPYYCNTVGLQYWKGRDYQKAAVAIYNIFQGRIGEDHLITFAILNYLDDQSLRALSQYSQLYL